MLAVGMLVWGGVMGIGAEVERHQATRLGSPSTRFAPPVSTPEELRARFADPRLRPDIASVLQQWGWAGNLEDLYGAARTNAIVEWPILVGITMPFMSSREEGRAVCLRNVLWAGKEAAPAYAFTFASNGRLYRCITPKACSNFFLDDLGPEPRYALALACESPAEASLGRPVEVCLVASNGGNRPERSLRLLLPIPEGAALTGTTGGGQVADGQVAWEIPVLEAGATQRVCAVFEGQRPGMLVFRPVVAGARAAAAASLCPTKVFGISGILLEVVDLEDPIEVGSEVTYEIRVTNQGTAPGINLRVSCLLSEHQEFVSASGATPVNVEGREVTMRVLPSLAAQAQAVWQVVVRAAGKEDARFKVALTGDQYDRPIMEDEATNQY